MVNNSTRSCCGVTTGESDYSHQILLLLVLHRVTVCTALLHFADSAGRRVSGWLAGWIGRKTNLRHSPEYSTLYYYAPSSSLVGHCAAAQTDAAAAKGLWAISVNKTAVLPRVVNDVRAICACSYLITNNNNIVGNYYYYHYYFYAYHYPQDTWRSGVDTHSAHCHCHDDKIWLREKES